jgi:tellurite methyltransferase
MADAVEHDYWNKVYAAGRYVRGEIPHDASPFAQDALPRMKEAVQNQLAAREKAEGGNDSVVVWEWGCGNGRDALFFAKQGLRVVGVDIAEVSIDALNKEHRDNKEIVFVTGDFTDETQDHEKVVADHFAKAGSEPDLVSPTHSQSDNVGSDSVLRSFSVGCIYSRFTIHSVKEKQASAAFRWAFKHLNQGGLLCVETRSVKDSLCGVGTQVEGERNAWIEDHYRRFSVKDEVLKELGTLGFAIDFVQEDTGLAVYKEEDPCMLRVFARKP